MKHLRISVLILCACLVSVAWSQQPTRQGRSDWTEFHRRNMMRWNPFEHVLNVNNVGSLHLKWSHRTKYAAGSPTVANGVVYFGTNGQNGGDGSLYALKAKTGAELWSYHSGPIYQSSPAVANGVVYIGNTNGNLYALNASTGALLWSYNTGGYVIASPTVANGVVYVSS